MSLPFPEPSCLTEQLQNLCYRLAVEMRALYNRQKLTLEKTEADELYLAIDGKAASSSTADTATTAESASRATESDHAASADTASHADSASNADYATEARSASTALSPSTVACNNKKKKPTKSAVASKDTIAIADVEGVQSQLDSIKTDDDDYGSIE